jgi:hypothetical protein
MQQFLQVILNNVKSNLNLVEGSKPKLLENNICQQFDIHNCGAYVAYFAKQRFTDQGQKAGDIMRANIGIHKITEIRKEMKLK